MRLPSSSRPTRGAASDRPCALTQGVAAEEVALVQLHRPAEARPGTGRSPRSARGRRAAWRLPGEACRALPGRTAWRRGGPALPTARRACVGADHDLHAVLAGVAGAADDAVLAVVARRRGVVVAELAARRPRSGPRHSSSAFGPCTAIMQVVQRLVLHLARCGRPCARSSQPTIFSRLEALTTIAQP